MRIPMWRHFPAKDHVGEIDESIGGSMATTLRSDPYGIAHVAIETLELTHEGIDRDD
jgi:hypothetical protein